MFLFPDLLLEIKRTCLRWSPDKSHDIFLPNIKHINFDCKTNVTEGHIRRALFKTER